MLRQSIFVFLALILVIISVPAIAAGRQCGPLPPTMMLLSNDSIKQQLNLSEQQALQWSQLQQNLKQFQVDMMPYNKTVKQTVNEEAAKSNPDLLKVFQAKQNLKNIEADQMNKAIDQQIQFFSNLNADQKTIIIKTMQANMEKMKQKNS